MPTRLPYQPPLDWPALLGFFRGHQLPGVERATDTTYERVVRVDGRVGLLRVSHEPGALVLDVQHVEVTPALVARVRRMFDLDADMAAVERALASQPLLREGWERQPGLRVAKGWDRFETAVITVLGQLVSVKFARVLAGELLAACGEPVAHPLTGEPIRLFPAREVLATAALDGVRTTARRKEAIRAIARLDLDALTDPRKQLRAVPGIGPWSAEYMLLRAFGDPDAFPATDYGLEQELALHPGLDPKPVRPYRAYAAIYLWQRYAERKDAP